MDYRHNRTMNVMVEDLIIEDGAVRPPTVGAVVVLPLKFIETDGVAEPATTAKAWLDPHPSGPQRLGTGTADQWAWTGLLRGDGWTAAWTGWRPRTGHVELTGKFCSILDGQSSGEVRGRVTRVQIVSERMRRKPTGRARRKVARKVAGHRRLRDVDAAPRFFPRPWLDVATDAALAADTRTGPRIVNTEPFLPDEYDDDMGVLVDLDLDDVPPIAPRPRIVPGDVSAEGGRWWVSDSELPLVAELIPAGPAREYILPGPASGRRRVWATPSGCWVTGTDGVYRIRPGEIVERVDHTPMHTAATSGDALLACGADSQWHLYRPGEPPVSIDAPEGRAVDVIAEEDSFLVLIGTGRGGRRLVRVTPTGGIQVGPYLHNIGLADTVALLPDPLRMVAGTIVSLVHPDLSTYEHSRLPVEPMDVGRAGGDVWITAHLPDGTGGHGWWPLAGPTEYDDRDDQYWLLTRLDGQSLEPKLSVPIFDTDAIVAVDGTTARVVAQGLFEIPDTTMQWPQEVDVAVLLAAADESRTQSSG
ncbi:MAG: hypothetical protein L0H59_11465, partial [Tomitella sp.]|nr:hypothetical protein [Tomitella sp.]